MARELLAFAVWQYPYTLTPEQRARKDQLDRLEELEHPFPEGSNQKLFDAYFAALEKKQMRWMDKSRDYRKSESRISKSSLWLCPIQYSVA